MNERQISTWAVAGTFVGTVVGAGFATGQEVMRFFTLFGLPGIWGVVGATALFAIFGSAVLRLAHRVRARSHREVVDEAVGPLIGGVLDWVIAFFLFVGAAIMMAGAGAVFAEHFGLSRFLGTALMAALATGTVLFGLRGVVTSISLVAPVLVVMVLLISFWTLRTSGIAPGALQFRAPEQAAATWWPVATLLYVSYNLLLAVSVLAPLGGRVERVGPLHLGGVIGGIALGVSTLAINLALLAGLPETLRFEVPMLYLAAGLPGWIKPIYTVVLWAEIYTTAVSSLFGLAARFTPQDTSRHFQGFALAAGLGALGLSQLGFSQMVATVFPAVGWLGLLFLVGLALRLLRGEGAPVR